MGNSLWHRSYDTIFAVNQLIEIAGKRAMTARWRRARAFLEPRLAFMMPNAPWIKESPRPISRLCWPENNVRILNESSRLLRHEADIAAARFKAGDLSDSDKKQIEINAEQFALQARSAEAAAIQARIAVEILIGMSQPRAN